jgi:hypothetical protein
MIEDSRLPDSAYAAPLTRGHVRSPDEPFIEGGRILRSLLRGLILGTPLALLGLISGPVLSLAGLLFGMVALPVAWVEFWAERRVGSPANDFKAVIAAVVVALIAIFVVTLELTYLEALYEGRGLEGAFSSLGGLVNNLDKLVLGTVLGGLIPSGAFGLSVYRRLRRYLPRSEQRTPWFVIVFLLILLGVLVAAAPAGACVFLVLPVLFGLVIFLLGLVYRWADEIELELRLWRERRAETVRE